MLGVLRLLERALLQLPDVRPFALAPDAGVVVDLDRAALGLEDEDAFVGVDDHEVGFAVLSFEAVTSTDPPGLVDHREGIRKLVLELPVEHALGFALDVRRHRTGDHACHGARLRCKAAASPRTGKTQGALGCEGGVC